MQPEDALALLDWKRRVFRIYESVRAADDPARAWREWRAARDELFRNHDQSPIPQAQRSRFLGLDFYDYSSPHRTTAEVFPEEPLQYEIGTSGGGSYSFTRFARAEFELLGESHSLELYWLDGYGGGLFLPFRDATAGETTYGAGRYLFDTVKGADLGVEDGRLVLDFNFAYNPSCSYDPRWVCPLAPPPNRLDVSIEAGERHVAQPE